MRPRCFGCRPGPICTALKGNGGREPDWVRLEMLRRNSRKPEVEEARINQGPPNFRWVRLVSPTGFVRLPANWVRFAEWAAGSIQRGALDVSSFFCWAMLAHWVRLASPVGFVRQRNWLRFFEQPAGRIGRNDAPGPRWVRSVHTAVRLIRVWSTIGFVWQHRRQSSMAMIRRGGNARPDLRHGDGHSLKGITREQGWAERFFDAGG
jgi:hypothetical protein